MVNNPKQVKTIQSKDCNAMYASCFQDKQFVGVVAMRRKETNFAPEIKGKRHPSLGFMHFIAFLQGREKYLQHSLTGRGEKYIFIHSPKNLVDWEYRKTELTVQVTKRGKVFVRALFL